MEEIQFFNYLFSLLALMLAAAAFYVVWTADKEKDIELKALREKINQVAEAAQIKKR